MKSSILGLIAGITIIIFAVIQSSDSAMSYFNYISLLIVVGGTISAAVITHGLKKILHIANFFFKAFQTAKHDNLLIIKELVTVSEQISVGVKAEKIMENDIHPYIKDGLRLIYNKFSEEKIIKISRTMLTERVSYYHQVIDHMRILAKYPPAFGMMGTIIGLIAVMKKMGAENAIDSVGVSMAIALTTTLYGLFLTNYIIHPISDNLSSRSERDIKVRKIIAEGILLLYRREDPIFVREVLMGYLLPHERSLFNQKFTNKSQNKTKKF